MASFNWNKPLPQNDDTRNISVNINQHPHKANNSSKTRPTDKINSNIQEYQIDIDPIQDLITYSEEMNLGKVEFSTFHCTLKRKIAGHYANVKLVNTYVASSFPKRCSHPEIAKQIAARNALAILKTTHSSKNIPVTQDIEVVADRLGKELQKNFAGLFCDKVEDIYKKVYNERLPENWLNCLNMLTTNIMIENLPNQNKSILYYTSYTEKLKYEDTINTSVLETIYENLPLMKFIDKTERRIKVVHIDNNDLTLWILFIHDSINSDYDTLFKHMNMQNESDNYHKMYSVDLLDIYAVQMEDKWYRFQPTKKRDNKIVGILIDLGMQWIVSTGDVRFLNQKFLNVPSQAMKCSLTSMAFASYFREANNLFHKLLLDKEFIVLPDNIEKDPPFVTLYSESWNMNSIIMKTIIEKTNFNKINRNSKNYNLCFINGGYLYIHPPNDTLLIMESIFETISTTHSLEELYCKNSISLHKVYLVKCEEFGTWSRALVDKIIFADKKVNVYFIDYGNYGLIDQDKFIDLKSIDTLLAAIGPQALKVSFHLFPPDKLTNSLSKALYEMVIDKVLDINVVSTNSDGIEVVELYDADDETGNCVSFNTLLYQSV